MSPGRVIGITWPAPEAMDDAELERRLLPAPRETAAPRAVIDWRQVHEEVKRHSMTLVSLRADSLRNVPPCSALS